MPHAALWVVQPYYLGHNFYDQRVSMPHAALWVVQQGRKNFAVQPCLVSMPHAAVSFRPHHRFAVPLPRSRAGEAWLRLVFSQNHAILASPADAGEVASTASR